MKNIQSLLLSIYIVGFIGWCINIAKIVYAFRDGSDDEAIFRLIAAIFVPIGAIAGYF